MDDIFTHDATPTWSGFIYQGEVAIYLAVKKICELKSNGLEIDIIGSNYQIEVENCEDIAIVRTDGKDRQYLSIHQVKNQKDDGINSYKNPLVQLMLERGYWEKRGLGSPDAYLHVSNKIKEDSTTIDDRLKAWKLHIQKYYDRMSAVADKILEEADKSRIIDEIENIVRNEPIQLKRADYKKLLTEIQNHCADKHCDITVLNMKVQKLLEFLNEKLGINCIDEKVHLYQYEDNKMYCKGTDLFNKIVEQVKKYKNNDNNLSHQQYEYIADKLLHYMRQHIIERHQKIQRNEMFKKNFLFHDIVKILDGSISEYETEANILALRRLYDEHISQYCRLVCDNQCIKSENTRCKLQNIEYRRTDLGDKDFVRMCYGYNPECDKDIDNRQSLSKLLKEDGLNESVFEVLSKVPRKFFIDEGNRTRFVLNYQKGNAFLTAISSSNKDIIVDGIVGGINNNAELVSPVFEADELITARLHSDESIWENKFSEIDEKYISDTAKNNSDDNENSICRPKKPKFVRAEDVINKFCK